MRNRTIVFCLTILALLAGCQGNEIFATVPAGPEDTATAELSITPAPASPATPTPTLPRPSLSATPTATGTEMPTSTPAIPPEARLTYQCLDITPTLTDGIPSSGIVALRRGSGSIEYPRFETMLLNPATGQATQIFTQDEYQFDHAVSSDRVLIAYSTAGITADGHLVKNELVIATADGQRQVSLPWEEEWRMILNWTDDQRLLLTIDDPVLDAGGEQVSWISYLILDPFSGERQLLQPNLPSALDLAYLLYWPDLIREIYNPNLSRAIYPRYIGSDEETYTFAVWDMVEQRLVVSLESIYENGVQFSRASPLPQWSPDGSQFVVISQFLVPDQDWAVFELFRVSQEGQVEQLTHLNPILRQQAKWLSWSPGGRYIALVLSTYYSDQVTSAAVLNMETLEITNYCIPVRGLELPAPVWSPDGTQFLMVDEDEEGHRRVILVDIVHGFAVQIAEDMNILGWMVMP